METAHIELGPTLAQAVYFPSSLVSNSSPRFSSTPSTLAQVLIKSMKTPSKTAIVGAIVGAVVLLIGIVTMLFFCRRRYTPKTPVGNIGGTEREPDPTLDSARDNLLNGDGQPADHEGVFPDTVSETSTKQKKTATSIAAITEGIAHGASLAGDAVLSLQRRLFKRLTSTETTAEMELEPSVFGSEFPEDSTPKYSRRDSSLNLDRDDGQLKPSSLVCETPVDSTPEIPREGFFAKMTRKTRKAPTAESTAKEVLSGDDGLTFQERLFKRSTTKSTIENTPEVEMESPFLNEESVSSTDSEQHSSSANENEDTPPLSATKGSGFLAAALFNVRPRLFKRTATETTFSENNDLGTDSSAIERSTSPRRRKQV
ncbi:hypothetical protein B0H13DRAFT_2431649 [Mycena leptocephala]|nr:hypothetical protein B0H13DRAFT_2431649 [Mycena leptocephala]